MRTPVFARNQPVFRKLLACGSLLLASLVPVGAVAADAQPPVPHVVVGPLHISVQNNKITGTSVVSLSGSQQVDGIGLVSGLYQEQADHSLEQISQQPVGSAVFSLKAGEKRTVSFTHEYPMGIPSGRYQLMVQAFGHAGTLMGLNQTPVDLLGSVDRLLVADFKGAAVLVDGKEYPALGTKLVKDGQSVALRFPVRNPHEYPATVQTKVSLYAGYPLPGVKAAYESEGALQSVPANEAVTMDVPVTSPKPLAGRYYAIVRLVDSQGAQYSGLVQYSLVYGASGAGLLWSTARQEKGLTGQSVAVQARVANAVDATAKGLRLRASVSYLTWFGRTHTVSADSSAVDLAAAAQTLAARVSLPFWLPARSSDARLAISLIDSSGKTLDSQSGLRAPLSSGGGAWAALALLVLFVLCLAGAGWLLLRRSKRRGAVRLAAVALLACGLIMAHPQLSQAGGNPKTAPSSQNAGVDFTWVLSETNSDTANLQEGDSVTLFVAANDEGSNFSSGASAATTATASSSVPSCAAPGSVSNGQFGASVIYTAGPIGSSSISLSPVTVVQGTTYTPVSTPSFTINCSPSGVGPGGTGSLCSDNTLILDSHTATRVGLTITFGGSVRFKHNGTTAGLSQPAHIDWTASLTGVSGCFDPTFPTITGSSGPVRNTFTWSGLSASFSGSGSTPTASQTITAHIVDTDPRYIGCQTYTLTTSPDTFSCLSGGGGSTGGGTPIDTTNDRFTFFVANGTGYSYLGPGWSTPAAATVLSGTDAHLQYNFDNESGSPYTFNIIDGTGDPIDGVPLASPSTTSCLSGCPAVSHPTSNRTYTVQALLNGAVVKSQNLDVTVKGYLKTLTLINRSNGVSYTAKYPAIPASISGPYNNSPFTVGQSDKVVMNWDAPGTTSVGASTVEYRAGGDPSWFQYINPSPSTGSAPLCSGFSCPSFSASVFGAGSSYDLYGFALPNNGASPGAFEVGVVPDPVNFWAKGRSSGTTTLTTGEPVDFTWHTGNAASANPSGSQPAVQRVEGGTLVNLPLASTNSDCSSACGSDLPGGPGTYVYRWTFGYLSKDVTITVNAPSAPPPVTTAPTVHLMANGQEGTYAINDGDAVDFTWNSTDATAMTATRWDSGTPPASPAVTCGSGCVPTDHPAYSGSAATKDYTYTLQATGPGGVATATVVVRVNKPPVPPVTPPATPSSQFCNSN